MPESNAPNTRYTWLEPLTFVNVRSAVHICVRSHIQSCVDDVFLPFAKKYEKLINEFALEPLRPFLNMVEHLLFRK